MFSERLCSILAIFGVFIDSFQNGLICVLMANIETRLPKCYTSMESLSNMESARIREREARSELIEQYYKKQYSAPLTVPTIQDVWRYVLIICGILVDYC